MSLKRRTKKALAAHADKMERKKRARSAEHPSNNGDLTVYRTGVKRGGPGGTRTVRAVGGRFATIPDAA